MKKKRSSRLSVTKTADPVDASPLLKNSGLYLITILLIAFSLRFMFFYQMARSPIADMLPEDSQTYNAWAQEIARGDWIGKEVFFALPFYPYLLGLLYRLFGVHLQLIKFLQVLLGTLNCFLLFQLGKKLFCVPVALLSSFMMAAYAWLIVYDSAILPSSVAIFLNLSILLLFLHLKEKQGKTLAWLAGGILVGLSASADAHILLFVPLLLAWLLTTPLSLTLKKKTNLALFFLLGLLIIIGTITYRNWRVGRDFVPLTAHGGINFYIGNNPDAHGVFEPPPILRTGGATLKEDSIALAQDALGRTLKPSEVSGYWSSQAMEFITTYPDKFFLLFLKKFILFWTGTEIPDVIHPDFFKPFSPVLRLPLLTFSVVAPLALLGIMLSWRLRKRISLLCFFVAANIMATLLYFVSSRYRLQVVPFLMLFAGYAIYWFLEKIIKKEWKHLVPPLLCLIPFCFFVNPGLLGKKHERFSIDQGAGHCHIADYYMKKGDFATALQEYQKALDLEPDRPEANSNVGDMYFRMREYDKALKAYAKATAINPHYESAHLKMALSYEKTGQRKKAEEKYKETIAALPRSINPYLVFGQFLFYENRLDEATNVLETALSYYPQTPVLYLHLGLLYRQKGDFDQAQQKLEKGLAYAPNDGKIHLLLGELYAYDLKDESKALTHLTKAARCLPPDYLAHLELAKVFTQMGKTQEAAREQEVARTLKPEMESLGVRPRS